MRSFLFCLICVMSPKTQARADDPPATSVGEQQFRVAIQPFLKTYCLDCHSAEKSKGGLDLASDDSFAAVAKNLRKWESVADQLRVEAMPPEKSKHHPSAESRKAVMDWIRAVRKAEAKRTAGDPGPVPARRLSHAEYDHSIRDLTGVDIRPTKEFPVDPSNEAGFDNSAESLAMSPALVKKFLQAARLVADHLVLTPDGITFAAFPAVAETDRDKYAVRQVIDFYRKQRTDYADYLFAAWKYQHRETLGKPGWTLAEVAKQNGISGKYLATIWSILQSQDSIGPIAAVNAMWRDVPSSDAKAARENCNRIRDFIREARRQLTPVVKNLSSPGLNGGSQPLVMWKNQRQSANRMRYSGGALAVLIDDLEVDSPAAQAMTPPHDPAAIAKYEATFLRFCEVFPDQFVVSERARTHLDPEKERNNSGRLLNAGFHSMTGYYRDDEPLYQLILDDSGQRELDRLWREFDFVTRAPIRQYSSFIWYEIAESSFIREAEFSSFRAEDKDVTTQPRIEQLAELYLAKVKRRGGSEVAQLAVADHFKLSAANIRRVEADLRAAEPKHLIAIETFAERAFRRPLTTTERKGLSAFYRSLKETDGLSHEDAVRDSIVGILMSPHFCFRTVPAVSGPGVRVVSDIELASRLSFFLWASLPDAELSAKARAGELHRPEILAYQARRMLNDSRSRGLATEFAANWLDIRRFEEHNAVDRGRFPAFDAELRQAMFEEPIRFFLDVVHSDRSIFDFLDADHTFVNRPLAKHYGMPEPKSAEWVRVDRAVEYGRGGLLPMSVFLTKNAPGLRTSPVKRGNWVVRKLLGETIPAPPSEVPELPADEAKTDLPLRELLAKHRDNKACSRCHDLFDGIGLAFEGYGPIGERRKTDLGGKPIDAKAPFPGGSEGEGLAGLKEYLRKHRQEEFVDNFCRKLLAYALGRSLIPGDDQLIETMKNRLAKNGYRFGILVDTIVGSRPFLNVRGDVATID